MAFTEALRLVIDADTRGAVQGVEKLGAVSDRELSRSKASLDKWGHGLTNAGAALIGVGGAALFGLGKAAMAAEEAQLSVIKLENSLKNMPKLAGESSKQFIDLADSLQDVTAADADAIVEGEALLATFGVTADELKGILPLVVDYARKFGIDIPDAAIQVGKALDGQVGALKRNGVSIDEVLFKTDRYRAVNEALTDQVGGFAEAEGKTFAGSLERLKNEMGDLAEGIGVGAVDAFTSMFGVVDGLTDRFGELSPETQSAIGKIATFGATGLVVAGGMSVLVGQVILARERFGEIASAARVAGSHIADFRGQALVAGISLTTLVLGLEGIERLFPTATADVSELENALVKLSRSGDVTGELADAAGRDLGKLRDAIKEVGDPALAEKATHALDSVLTVGGLLPGGTGNLDQARQTIDDVDKALAKLAARDPEEAARAVEKLTDALKEQGIDAGTVKSLLNDYNSTLAEVDTAGATAGVDGLGTEMEEQEEKTVNATTAIERYNDTLRAQLDPLFGAISASNQLADANAAVTEAKAKVTEAEKEHGVASEEATAAQQALSEAQFAAVQAAQDEELAFNELSDAVISQGLSVDGAKAKLDQWVAQNRITQESADAVKARIDLYAASLGLIPGGKNTDLTTTGTANSDVANLKRQLDGLPLNKNVEVNFNVRTPPGVSIGQVLTFRQHGGPLKAREPSIVGEDGWELFVPEVAGRIMSHADSMRLVSAPSMGAGGGTAAGGATVAIHIGQVVANDPVEFAQGLSRYVRQNGPGEIQRMLGMS